MRLHTFDTHKYIKELQETGFKEKQAEVIVKSLLESRDNDFSQLSTKQDIELVRSELKQEIVTTKQDLESVRSELKQEIELLRSEVKQDIAVIKKDIQILEGKMDAKISSVKFDILKWVMPFLITIMISIISLFSVLLTR